MTRQLTATITTLLATLTLLIGCGGIDELETPDEHQESVADEIASEATPRQPRARPDGKEPVPPARPTNQREDLPVVEEPLVEEPLVEEPLVEEPIQPALDLQCADDPAICRFCGPAEAVATSCPPDNGSFECEVFRGVNEIRAAHGLNQLTYDATLAESAKIHAMDLSLCDYFAHNSLDGTTFFQRCADNGYDGTCTGENVGGGQSSPQAVLNAWMASPGHKENILYPHHRQLGVAFYVGDGNYTRYWVKHFGRP